MKQKMTAYLSIIFLTFLLTACGSEKLTDAMYEAAAADAAAGNLSNRELTRQEQFAYYDMEARYRYEGAKASGIGEKELPALLRLEDGNGNKISYWVYPEQEMTDTQLLAKAEKQFEGMPPETYRPKDGQIPYSEVEGLFTKLVQDYHISDAAIEKIYSFYWSASSQGLDTGQDIWAARISLTEGLDCEIIINANDGTLLEWYSRPEGWFDQKQEPEGFAEARGEYTSRQAEDAAKAYMESIGFTDISMQYQAAPAVQQATPQAPVRQSVQAVFESGSCRIFINLEDLSVCGFMQEQ